MTISLDTKIYSAVWGPLNETIICSCDDGTIRQFSTEDGKEKLSVKEHKNKVTKISLSQDKTLLISASSDNTSKLFITKNLKLLKTYMSGEPVNIASISPLKMHVILGGGTEAMDVTQTSTKNAYYEVRFFSEVFEEEIGTVKGHFGPIHALEFSPNGKSYASGGEDGIVRLCHFDNEYLELKDK